MNYIAFDLGGSGGKVVLASYKNGNLNITPLRHFEHNALSIGKHLYWDVLKIYDELVLGIADAIDKTKDSITSLGIDSFCNDFAIVSQSGELITQVHSYRDARTSIHESEIYNKIKPHQLYQINGNQCASFNTFMQLGAMVAEKEHYLLENNNQLLFLPDLLHFFLSGKRITEYTLASVSQMFDYSTHFWSPEILESLMIPESLFAPIVDPGVVFARTSADFNKEMHTKGFSLTTVCEHDTGSAFLASVCGRNTALISCGTWALVGTEVDSPIINDFGYQYNIANEGGAPGSHHRILRNVMGTWIIQEIRAYYKSQGIIYSYSELEELATKGTPFQYYIDVDDSTFFSPGNMPEKIQNYCLNRYGSAPQNIGDMVLCIYENLAYKFRWNMEKLSQYTGKIFNSVNILGGGSQSRILCQLTANVTQLSLEAGPVEATVLGNVIMQLIATKQISSIEEGRYIVRNNFKTVSYLPQDNNLWAENYKQYKNTLKLN
ncbi:MAG: rhamnulokinase [Hespellia sp.]|nr:rhamnulokinase [Hespellia sp.]